MTEQQTTPTPSEIIDAALLVYHERDRYRWDHDPVAAWACATALDLADEHPELLLALAAEIRQAGYSDLDDRTEAHPCPQCGAAPGIRCISASGRVWCGDYHDARVWYDVDRRHLADEAARAEALEDAEPR